MFAMSTLKVVMAAMIVATCTSVSPTLAGEWYQHPFIEDLAPLPVDSKTDFETPTWVPPCSIVTAQLGVSLSPGSCVDKELTAKSGRIFKFRPPALDELTAVNNALNARKSGTSLSHMAQLAMDKRLALIEMGFPARFLQLGVAEKDGVPFDQMVHAVLFVTVGPGVVVLDGAIDVIVPWQYSLHRFVGIHLPLEDRWVAVVDEREEPVEHFVEWACAVEHCPVTRVQ